MKDGRAIGGLMDQAAGHWPAMAKVGPRAGAKRLSHLGQMELAIIVP